MSDAIPVGVGATVGAVGSLAFIVYGRSAAEGAQAKAERLTRKRIATRLAFVYLAAAVIWGSITVIAETSATAKVTAGIVVMVAMAVATFARSIRNAGEEAASVTGRDP